MDSDYTYFEAEIPEVLESLYKRFDDVVRLFADAVGDDSCFYWTEKFLDFFQDFVDHRLSLD